MNVVTATLCINKIQLNNYLNFTLLLFQHNFFKGKKLKIRSYQEFSHENQVIIRNRLKSGIIRKIRKCLTDCYCSFHSPEKKIQSINTFLQSYNNTILRKTRQGWKFGMMPLSSLRPKAHLVNREILPYFWAHIAFKVDHAKIKHSCALERHHLGKSVKILQNSENTLHDNVCERGEGGCQ